MDFPKIAKELIEKLGGKENISGAAHCSTRLRLVLNDENKADKEGIEQIEGVKGQFAVAGQYQIIFGAGTVNKVHAAMTEILGLGDMTKSDVGNISAEKQGLLRRVVNGLAGSLVPIIPATVAGGLRMGVAKVFTERG